MKFGSIISAGKVVAGLFVGLALTVATAPVQAQTFSLIHTFTGESDGGSPLSGLIIDKAGNLYGTASYGGGAGYGVVLKLAVNGEETVLHNFAGGTDGATPEGRLVRDAAGNLFGTTFGGGTSGDGTIFEINSKGKEIILHRFTGANGAYPEAGLTMDAKGDLYGTTTAGGANGNGTVFKLEKNTKGKWIEHVLYSFGPGTDGTIPVAGITLDKAGNIYGTTSAGGTYTYGTIFELTRGKTGWTESILHDFQDAADGGVPYAGLVFDQSGNIYGAATEANQQNDGGTVFQLTPANGTWNFNVLYTLPGWGISGTFRDVLLDAAGNLYATTHCDGSYSAGTVYELTPTSGTWTYTSLYVFTGGSDGEYSFSNLVFDKQGNLYGTTNTGGANYYGVVFKIAP